MSLVTDACLYVDYAPIETLEALTQPLPFDTERQQFFKKVPADMSGGTKLLGARVYVAGFNYVSPDDLIEWLRSLRWYDPKDAVLIVQQEGDEPEIHYPGAAQ